MTVEVEKEVKEEEVKSSRQRAAETGIKIGRLTAFKVLRFVKKDNSLEKKQDWAN